MTVGDTLAERIAGLAKLDLAGLRTFWAAHFGAPPPLRSPDLLRYLIAWRLQEGASGGLDHDIRRKVTGRGPVEAEGLHLGPGAIIRREWQGRLIEVVVGEDGFRWDGTDWPSLSAVARAATGTRWNGPRFFGLRAGQS